MPKPSRTGLSVLACHYEPSIHRQLILGRETVAERRKSSALASRFVVGAVSHLTSRIRPIWAGRPTTAPD